MPTITSEPPAGTAPQGKREPLWFLGGLATVEIDSDETGGEYSLIEITSAPGRMTPLHVHHRDDEVFFVLEGEIELYVGDEIRALPAGTTIRAPRGIAHTYRVSSQGPARCLVFSSPGGFDRFVRAVSDPAQEPTLPPETYEPDMDRLASAATEAGIEILGPPGTLPSA
jgi:quercetin dioxygenase-like cupin family protein